MTDKERAIISLEITKELSDYLKAGVFSSVLEIIHNKLKEEEL